MSTPPRSASRARWLVPEVIQTSWMDCGPASLKSLLAGFGIHADYSRLRDLCQIDVDGTSIDVLESIGTALGLPLQQLVIPPDYLLDEGAPFLPAIAVTRLPNGNQHFAVLWRRSWGRVQEMDPMAGRRWLRVDVVRARLHIHEHSIDAESWRILALSELFLDPLRRRLHRLGLSSGSAGRLVDEARADASWRGLATLDAAARMTAQVLAAGGLRRGGRAERFLCSLLADSEREGASTVIPRSCWSVREDTPGQLIMRGAVVLTRTHEQTHCTDIEDRVVDARARVSAETLQSLARPPVPLRSHLLQLMRRGGLAIALTVGLSLLLLACGFFMEMFMMRAGLQLDHELTRVDERLGAALGLLSLVVLLPVLEGISIAGTLRMGRHLEARFRIALYEKISRLGERYFRTRLASDLAERAHQLHLLRRIPGLGLALGESLFELAVSLGAVYWIDPRSMYTAAIFGTIIVGTFFACARPPLVERDLRLRNHAGALSRYYLDALLGAVPVRTHGAERAISRGHDGLLIEWTRTAKGLRSAVVLFRAWQIVLVIAMVVGIVVDFAERTPDHRRLLMLVFWVLVVVDALKRVTTLGINYPAHYHAALRAFEPIGSPETVPAPASRDAAIEQRLHARAGIDLSMRRVTVSLGGFAVLTDIDLQLRAGEHVAVVGRSGGGKSTLLGLLLGVADRTEGTIEANGMPLDTAVAHELRRTTAWIDPAVQLWNDSVLGNLLYGSDTEQGAAKLGDVTFRADLRRVLADL
ncbi:MAG: ATP-binding cassette domain-containing protein, partial [Nannocystaceae bacterium]